MDIRILMLGDCAFTVEYATLQGPAGAKRIRALREAIQRDMENGQLTGIVDLLSASRSLSVVIDPMVGDLVSVCDHVEKLAHSVKSSVGAAGGLWHIPVCYGAEYGPDLPEIADRAGLSLNDVISLHTDEIYDVLVIGFMPGFPFMAEICEQIRFPRRTEPRVKVPAGSVAIANNQTAIYPWESPGGWHLLGRCPLKLFDANLDKPSLFTAGDRVQFSSISTGEYEKIAQDVALGNFDYDSLKAGAL